MTEFWLASEWFIYGFVAGLVAPYAWQLTKQVVREYKLAREQWAKPPAYRRDYE